MATMTIDETMALALEHYSGGRLHETEGLCRRILQMEPHHGAALHLLGVLALQTGNHDAAIDLMRRAIAANPNVAEYYSNLAVALTARGRLDEARSACRQALGLNPNLAEAHYNHGNALRDARLLGDAAAAYRQALAIRFDYPEAHNNLATVLKDMGQLDQAITGYRQAAILKPDYAHALSNLANALKDVGQQDGAVATHRQAVDLAPGRPEIHSNLLLSLQYPLAADAALIAQESRRWNDRHAQPIRASIPAHANDRNPERALRIGFVSADLRMHSVAFFLVPLIEARDRKTFHAVCYATDARSDDVTERLRAGSDEWESLVGVSDDDAARRIRDDRIDILIDLGGHTAGNRLMLFARKPAPVQITYLGYVGTTGLSAIDYRLTDACADPPGADDGGPERLIRLPRGAWCFAPLSGEPVVADLPALRAGHVTFGSFNNLAKVTPYTMQLWTRILQQVPASRLLVKSALFRSPEARRRFQAYFTDRGIDLTRLELVGDEPSQLQHLQQYDRVDIALDTFPYHGVTTTCEALWMGVPVLTLAGQRHASRIGVSLLTNAGYPEFVAQTPEAYVRQAADLVADLPRLATMRATMRDRLRSSPLMDAPQFAASLEAALRDAWRHWCVGSPELGSR